MQEENMQSVVMGIWREILLWLAFKKVLIWEFNNLFCQWKLMDNKNITFVMNLKKIYEYDSTLNLTLWHCGLTWLVLDNKSQVGGI